MGRFQTIAWRAKKCNNCPSNNKEEWSSLELYYESEWLAMSLVQCRVSSDKNPYPAVLGEEEIIYEPQKVLWRSTRLMPCLEVKIIPGTRHIVNVKQPELLNSAMLKFLE